MVGRRGRMAAAVLRVIVVAVRVVVMSRGGVRGLRTAKLQGGDAQHDRRDKQRHDALNHRPHELHLVFVRRQSLGGIRVMIAVVFTGGFGGWSAVRRLLRKGR